MKMRADAALAARGLAPSREKAQALIMAGCVYVGEQRVDKPSQPVAADDALVVRGGDTPFVSRGGQKLERGLDVFGVDVAGLAAMDIGAAAGGFTDVLLRRGARHVYAIDVGYGQLDWALRSDPRVTVMERTNARYITPDLFALKPAITVMDVSFISIRLILPAAAKVMGDSGRFVTLIKPQFEAGRGQVGKHGVVRGEAIHAQVLADICAFARGMGWGVRALTWSPVKGPRGNIEFLADIRHGAPESGAVEADIPSLVARAHRALADGS